MTRRYTDPQKRGRKFSKLLAFLREDNRQTITIKLPRACKSYPYEAASRAGVKVKAVYTTVKWARDEGKIPDKRGDHPDDIIRFIITKTKHAKTPEQREVDSTIKIHQDWWEPKHETPKQKTATEPKAEKKAGEARHNKPKLSVSGRNMEAANLGGGKAMADSDKLKRGRPAKTQSNVIPLAPTKGVDITQLANV